MGVHQLGRLVELLTSRECENLFSALSHPEENIFQQLDHLSLENNQLDLQKRVKRDTGTATLIVHHNQKLIRYTVQTQPGLHHTFTVLLHIC